MRLVFFYVSWKHGYGEGIDWKTDHESDNFFSKRLEEEGYCLLLRHMLNHEIVDDVLVLIESKSDPGRFWPMGMSGHVIPSIENAWYFIKDDDIIWVRGAWKHWHDVLIEFQEAGHWLMLYAANTGREKWPFWDIVFNDQINQPKMDSAGRLQYPFRKPIQEDIFFPKDLAFPKNQEYDIMIGASHVHDKKGQWRMIDALIKYKEIFGENLKAVLPGEFKRGFETNNIVRKISDNDLTVELPGMLERKDLARYMNRTRLFVHLGSHGQADRGPIEAMACGCPVMIGYPQYHTKWLAESETACFLCHTPNDPEKVARDIYLTLPKAIERRRHAFEAYCANSLVNGALPDMIKLFSLLALSPERNVDFLKKLEGLS